MDGWSTGLNFDRECTRVGRSDFARAGTLQLLGEILGILFCWYYCERAESDAKGNKCDVCVISLLKEEKNYSH